MDMHPSADSFERVFRKFYSLLVLFARRLVRDKPAAEDIVSDVFCKLWQKQMHFDSPQSAKAFLYISTRNACINYLHRSAYQAGVRKAIRYSRKEETLDFALNEIIRAEMSGQLMQQVDNLPGQCRRVMRLSFVLGYSNREIADMLQLSINTVRNQKARGIHLVRKRLALVSGSGFGVSGYLTRNSKPGTRNPFG
jgi:RNA polymerase sigma-70 factor (family 1)